MMADRARLPGSGPWESRLCAGALTVVRTVGFEPVGQVFGAAVYRLTFAGRRCPGAVTRYRLRDAPQGAPGMSLTTVSGDGAHGDGAASPAAALAQVLYAGRRTAIDRMAAECAELGGHGVVGVWLEVSEVAVADTPPGSPAVGGIEFKVSGTAVRAAACPPLASPFMSHLSGQDFAKLITGGWVPAGIALGISVAARHDDLLTTGTSSWGAQNAEVPAYTDLIVKARRDARSQLELQVRGLGADGVVVSGMAKRVRRFACRVHRGSTDHFAEVVITGTAIARFAASGAASAAPTLAVLPVGPPAGGVAADGG